MYLDRVQKIHSWNLAIRYSDTAAGLFLVLQMVLVVIAFGIADQSLRTNTLKRLLLPGSIKPLLWGALTGIGVSFASSPLLLIFDEHTQFVRLLLDDPISLQTIVIVFLLGLPQPEAVRHSQWHSADLAAKRIAELSGLALAGMH